MAKKFHFYYIKYPFKKFAPLLEITQFFNFVDLHKRFTEMGFGLT